MGRVYSLLGPGNKVPNASKMTFSMPIEDEQKLQIAAPEKRSIAWRRQMMACSGVKILDRKSAYRGRNPVAKSEANQGRRVRSNFFSDALVGGATGSTPTAQTTGRHAALVGVRSGVWPV